MPMFHRRQKLMLMPMHNVCLTFCIQMMMQISYYLSPTKHQVYPCQDLRNTVAQNRKFVTLQLHTISRNDKNSCSNREMFLRRRTNLSVNAKKSGQTKNVHVEVVRNSNNVVETKAYMTNKKSAAQDAPFTSCLRISFVFSKFYITIAPFENDIR